MPDRTGQQFGSYRLLRLLGEWSFSEVYLGEHIYLKTQAAVKLLHARLDQGEMEVFLEEAHKIASLEHPFIVRIIEFAVEGKHPFMVMS